MICQRCRGLLVREALSDLREEPGCMCPAMRCINCGFIEDSVVRANRLHPPAAKRTVPRGVVTKGVAVFPRPHSERYRSL
jgi:RNase P subunit RPR2